MEENPPPVRENPTYIFPPNKYNYDGCKRTNYCVYLGNGEKTDKRGFDR
jgi:hypothetical protein